MKYDWRRKTKKKGNDMNPLITQPGDIIFVEGNSFLAKAIKFFSGSRWSHCAVGWGDILGRQGRPINLIFESNLLNCLTEWGKTAKAYPFRIYRWRDIDMAARFNAVRIVFDEFNGQTYGFMQLPWFIYRWLIEKLHLPKRWAVYNFFPRNAICTEVAFRTLEELPLTPELADMLLKYKKDSVTPRDLEEIMLRACMHDHAYIAAFEPSGLK